jgi:diaminopropionate ammonia-lyase
MKPPEPRSTRWVENGARDRRWTCPPVAGEVRDFHRRLPGYAPTPLVDLPDLAREFGVGHVVAKDESARLGLPAFKGLGASWAIHRALRSINDAEPVTIVTATDGNHGRAVAHFARRLGHRAHILVPDGVHPAAVQAIRDEGAAVTHVPGTYDDALDAAARQAERSSALLVQDTAREGYSEVPTWIVDGYSTLFAEIDDQLQGRGITPDLVVVPTGVGSLLQAALAHYRSASARPGTATVSVGPVDAACVLAGVAAGRPVSVDTGRTVMAGLNCGTVSTLAWPFIAHGLDACISVTDPPVADAARDLAGLGVPAGPCGAAPLAALRAVDATAAAAERDHRRTVLGLSPTATVVLLVTEGAAANPQLDPSAPPRRRQLRSMR